MVNNWDRSIILQKKKMVICYQEFSFSLIYSDIFFCHIRDCIDIVQEDITSQYTSEQSIPIRDDRFAGIIVPFWKVCECLMLPWCHDLIGCEQVKRRCLVSRIREKGIAGIEKPFCQKRILECIFLICCLVGHYI